MSVGLRGRVRSAVPTTRPEWTRGVVRVGGVIAGGLSLAAVLDVLLFDLPTHLSAGERLPVLLVHDLSSAFESMAVFGAAGAVLLAWVFAPNAGLRYRALHAACSALIAGMCVGVISRVLSAGSRSLQYDAAFEPLSAVVDGALTPLVYLFVVAPSIAGLLFGYALLGRLNGGEIDA